MLEENLIASKFFMQRLQAYLTQFSSWIGLIFVSFYSYDVISNVRTSNFERFNKTKTLCKIITKNHTHQIEISLNSSEEDSDHLSKLPEQNGEEYEDVAEEVEDSGKRKGKQTKETIQRKQKKRKFEVTDRNNKKDWNDNETMDFIDILEENPCLWDVFIHSQFIE